METSSSVLDNLRLASRLTEASEILVLIMDDERKVRESLYMAINGRFLRRGTKLSTEDLKLPEALSKSAKTFRQKRSIMPGLVLPRTLKFEAKIFEHPSDCADFIRSHAFALMKKTIVGISDINFREFDEDGPNRRKKYQSLVEHVRDINNNQREDKIPISAHSTCDSDIFDKMYSTENNYAGRTIKPQQKQNSSEFKADKQVLEKHLALWFLWETNRALSEKEQEKEPPQQDGRYHFNPSLYPTLQKLVEEQKEKRAI